MVAGRFEQGRHHVGAVAYLGLHVAESLPEYLEGGLGPGLDTLHRGLVDGPAGLLDDADGEHFAVGVGGEGASGLLGVLGVGDGDERPREEVAVALGGHLRHPPVVGTPSAVVAYVGSLRHAV